MVRCTFGWAAFIQDFNLIGVWIFLFLVIGHLWGEFNFELMELMELMEIELFVSLKLVLLDVCSWNYLIIGFVLSSV